MSASDTRTELTDSLLHTDIKRIFLGVICGFAAGLFMFGVTTLVTPTGMGKLWWFQLTATSLYGGQAMAYEVSRSVIIGGVVIHFALACFCGLIVGKLTTTNNVKTLIAYGAVLGGLCWLASNMFAPNFLNIHALDEFGQWSRALVFVSFGMVLGVLMSIAGKATK